MVSRNALNRATIAVRAVRIDDHRGAEGKHQAEQGGLGHRGLGHRAKNSNKALYPVRKICRWEWGTFQSRVLYHTAFFKSEY